MTDRHWRPNWHTPQIRDEMSMAILRDYNELRTRYPNFRLPDPSEPWPTDVTATQCLVGRVGSSQHRMLFGGRPHATVIGRKPMWIIREMAAEAARPVLIVRTSNWTAGRAQILEWLRPLIRSTGWEGYDVDLAGMLDQRKYAVNWESRAISPRQGTSIRTAAGEEPGMASLWRTLEWHSYRYNESTWLSGHIRNIHILEV